MTASKHVSVVVIGAGPSGLSLAIELGLRGVDCLVVERNDRVGYAPRAKTTNVRTRTHLRRWGIADRLAELSPLGVEYPSTISFVTRLNGFGLANIPDASNCDPTRNPLYPEHGQWIPQYKLEQVLRERADSLPAVAIMFGTEFIAADQDGDTAQVHLKDVASGQEHRFSCKFAVGADGARSRMRDIVGATMTGTYGLSRNYNTVFRAPGLADAHAHGPATMYWQVNPVAPSLIGPMDVDDVWFFMPTRIPEGFEMKVDNAADLIRESTGINLRYEVLSNDEWIASSLIADRYRDRRLFLIGDACHLHPPFGGYGMNMGVADAVDLGWKLAAYLQGWGGALLLDSYESERRIVHEEVIAEADANHATLSNDFWREGLEDKGPEGDASRQTVGQRIVAAKSREFHTLGTVLGGCYRSSPIIADEGGTPAERDASRYVPSSAPGCLAPHLWRDDVSIYDLFGIGFSLLVGPQATHEDIDRARSEAAALDVPFAVVALTAAEAAGLYSCAMTLVRPDQYVAWRGHVWQDGTLSLATGRQPGRVVASA